MVEGRWGLRGGERRGAFKWQRRTRTYASWDRLGGRGNIVDRDVRARLLIEAISAKAARPQGHVVDREKYPEKVRCFVYFSGHL